MRKLGPVPWAIVGAAQSSNIFYILSSQQLSTVTGQAGSGKWGEDSCRCQGVTVSPGVSPAWKVLPVSLLGTLRSLVMYIGIS